MKKYILIVISILTVLILLSCGNGETSSSETGSSSEQESSIGNGVLIVQGTQIDKSIEVYPTYAKIPLLATLKGLGAEVIVGGTLCEIKYDEKTYIFDSSSKTLNLNGEATNLLPQSGEDNFVMSVENGDLILDDESLYETLNKMGISIRYNLDFDALKVEITKK